MSVPLSPKIDVFEAEARKIVNDGNFGGLKDKAIFWGHTQEFYSQFSHGRNNFLCALYQNQADPNCYKMDTLNVIEEITPFFDRYASDPLEVIDVAWDIFSRAFANAAKGDHAFIAVNDMRQDDYFVRVELPVIKNKFSCVTTLEPAIDNDHMFAFRKTDWSFDD